MFWLSRFRFEMSQLNLSSKILDWFSKMSMKRRRIPIQHTHTHPHTLSHSQPNMTHACIQTVCMSKRGRKKKTFSRFISFRASSRLSEVPVYDLALQGAVKLKLMADTKEGHKMNFLGRISKMKPNVTCHLLTGLDHQ